MLEVMVWKRKTIGKLQIIESKFGLKGVARSPNSVEVSNEVPARKKDLGPSAVGAEEDVPGDVDHGIVEESSHSGGKHSIATIDKQAAIEQLTPAPLLGTPDSSTGMERYSVKQIKYVLPITPSACYY